jgi:tetraacyldisaccharide 4'-kinase
MKFDFSRYWYRASWHPINIILLPFSWLFQIISNLRKKCYQIGLFKIQKTTKPVIVVGNITVGGTGKTPFVIWLAERLRSLGYHPGIISRGVGGKRQKTPCVIDEYSKASDVGDEALLLAKKSGCPVVIGINRPNVLKKLLQDHECDIVISDDGLQHYRLGRDIEIALVDATRQFGNQQLLPAGPLREKISRLHEIDFVVVNGASSCHISGIDTFQMRLEPIEFVSVKNEANRLPLDAFLEKKIHAVSGIGHPQQFFLMLQSMKLNIISHAFPDHYLYSRNDFDFAESDFIIMTEKDAVKCLSFADERFWYLKVNVHVSEMLEISLLKKLQAIKNSNR